MHKLPRLMLSVVLFANLAAPIIAQQPAPSIQLDVVVTDKSGNAISGLTQQDVTVLQDKDPTKILTFEAHGGPGIPPSEAHTQVFFVIDAVNTTHTKVVDAMGELKKFLLQNDGKLAYPTSLAFLTDRGVQIQTEPSFDGNGLAAALDQNTPGFRAVGDNSGTHGAEQELQTSLNALDSLIDLGLKTEGRKAVIWISPGWPLLSGRNVSLTPAQNRRIFESAAKLSRTLREARITLYSVDPLRGEETTQQTVFYQNFTKGLSKPDKAEIGVLGLQVLDVQTGGRAIFGNENIVNSLNRCIADLSAFYTLTIPAAPADRAHEYHSLTLKLANPGLTARTRTGYYSEPSAPASH